MFITFEGGEGSGKTTQIDLLRMVLEARACPVTVTREPGGTPLGEQVRSILLAQNEIEISPYAEAMLFNAARAQLMQDVIAPALRMGHIVLCDRFADSTLAYQGYGRGMDMTSLLTLNGIATDWTTPNLTILLDLPVEVGRRRKRSAGEWNRLDAEEAAFHTAVRDGYLNMANMNPRRWLVVDATRSILKVHEQIWRVVEERLVM